jgi:protease II
VPITIAYQHPQQGIEDAAVASNNSSSSSSSTVPRAPRPCLLHSYGFYGLTEDLSFDPVNLQLLQAGWVVGVAHLRGGGWGGRGWAAAGAGVHKGRALEDLQAAAAYLLQVRGRLGVWGW